jgi:excisionase family DNA binding protein
MTLIEAAAILGVTADTLRQQIKRGKLTAQKRGRDWFVTPREVARYQQENKR